MEEKKNSLIDGILAQANNSEPRKILYKTKKSAMNALKKNYLNGFSMSDELRNDREFILDAMNKGLNAYPCASEEVRSDEELAWKYVNSKYALIINLPRQFLSKKDYVVAMLTQNPSNYYNKLEMAADRDVVLLAANEPGNFSYIPEQFRSDKEIVNKVLAENFYRCIGEVTDPSVIDKDVLIANVDNTGYFEMMPEMWRANKDVAMAAVQYDGENLQYVPEELRSDKDVVLAAVEETPYAWPYVPDKLKTDTDILVAVARIDLEAPGTFWDIVEKLPGKLYYRKRIFIELVRYNAKIAGVLTKTKSHEFYMDCVTANWQALQYLPDACKADLEIVTAALKGNVAAIEYASEDAQRELKKNGTLKECKKLQKERDKEFLKKAIGLSVETVKLKRRVKKTLKKVDKAYKTGLIKHYDETEKEE